MTASTPGLADGFVEIGGPVRNAVFVRNCFCGLGCTSVNADDFDVFDPLQAVQMLFRECAGPNHADLHRVSS